MIPFSLPEFVLAPFTRDENPGSRKPLPFGVKLKRFGGIHQTRHG